MELAPGVVTVGERVRIKCSASYPSHISRLYRTHHETPIDTQNVSGSDWSVNFTITEADTKDSGQYNCRFERTVNGTEYVSPPSDSLDLTVKEELPRATISVEPPSGVVSSGRPILLNCTGVILNSGGQFYLYRDGETRGTRNVSGSMRSASFIVNDLIRSGKWSFNCGYAKIVKQTTYYSPRSEAVQVTVTDFNGTSNSFQNPLCLFAFVLLGLCLSWE
ncbi:osteoclast-associated immunoglobulin-like receptor [Cetorhinus maximus]